MVSPAHVQRARPASRQAWLGLALALGLQCCVHFWTPPPRARPEALGTAPDARLAGALALGDPIAFSRAMMLGLQAFDVQPGISLPYRLLDYDRLVGWLELVLRLNPRSQYPLLSASRLYAEVPDPARTRRMLDFIHRAFLQDPDRRWPWLAHAVLLARHRLGDQALALAYAHELRTQVHDPTVPHWATQMEILALADLDQRAAARVLLGGLLASGTIREPHERHFLVERLRQLDQEAGATTPLELARPQQRPP